MRKPGFPPSQRRKLVKGDKGFYKLSVSEK